MPNPKPKTQRKARKCSAVILSEAARHICGRKRGHRGNHKCGFQMDIDNEKCGHEWARAQRRKG